MSLPKGALNKPMSQFDIMKTPFIMFQAHKDDYYNMSQNSLSGIQVETNFSKIFFSPENVNLLQRQIIIEVFKRTNGEYLIEKQAQEDLQIVMRSIYIQHARHVPNNIRKQIQELNNLVTDDVVPGIISEANSYFGYLERAFAPRKIMDLPECTSSAGLRTLPSVSRTFGYQK